MHTVTASREERSIATRLVPLILIDPFETMYLLPFTTLIHFRSIAVPYSRHVSTRVIVYSYSTVQYSGRQTAVLVNTSTQ